MLFSNFAPAIRSSPVWVLVLLAGFAAPLRGDSPLPPGLNFRVEGASQQLEMIINTSRILSLDKKVPKAMVNNPDIVRVTPISPTQVQVSALKPGVTQVNLWDENEAVHSVDVIVTPDGRELDRLLKQEFPEAAIRVRPLASSVVISGYVPKPEMVSRIVKISEDFYPKVLNNMTVGGVQEVALHVKVMEVSRTKLRKLGFDWANLNNGNYVVQSASGLVNAAATAAGTAAGSGDTMRFGIINTQNSFFGYIEALRQYNLVKVLAEPTLVTVSGRPAAFNSGGSIPVVVPQSLGTVSIEYRPFGTRVDFVPIVLGNGNIRLEVRPAVSEIDASRSVTINNITVPGMRERWVDTAVEMKAGQTLALAGLIQERLESENKGLPWVADMPWVGAAFRRVQETVNEVELLVVVTPELIDAVDGADAPACGPGETTTSPSDVELYYRGYLEVPKCSGPCATGGCVAPTGASGPVPAAGPNSAARPVTGGRIQPASAPIRPGSATNGSVLKTGARPTAQGPGAMAPSGANLPRRPAGSPAPVVTGPNGTSPQMIGPLGYDVLE